MMWVVLALFGNWAYVDKLSRFINQSFRHESLQNKPPFTNQIRPPPVFSRGNLKSLKLNIKHSNYEPTGHKNNSYGLFKYYQVLSQTEPGNMPEQICVTV